MEATMQLTLFDYAALDTETRIVVQQRTTEIKALMKRAASDIIEIGQKLIEVKARLGHGNFGGWLGAEFEWTHQTAIRFMQVGETFKNNNLLNLNVAPSALYLLAAPSTPEGARREAIARAEEGETITYSKAQDIVGDHKESAHPFISDRDFDRQIEEAEDEPLTPYEQDAERRETQRQQQITVITGSSRSNEWYTPAYIIELAREVLGTIDLDPASSEAANARVQADRFFTAASDGYSHPWHGRMWLNPPYGKEEGERETNAMRWARKLITEYRAGRVEAAILLVKAALGYNWFEDLWYDWPTCLLRERLSFMRADGNDDGEAKHATALLYLGPDVEKFRAVFRPFGRVVLPEADE